MAVSNAPPADSAGRVGAIKGVELLIMPATGACLSSGYGPRDGKLHRGVDYFSKDGGDVLAAGAGVVLEQATRPDFGNMIVIDHGSGVFTRYAHMESFAAKTAVGAKVTQGMVLGRIGSSGATSVRHLHYEIMTGSYVSGVGTFGLSTHNPFDLPAAGA